MLGLPLRIITFVRAILSLDNKWNNQHLPPILPKGMARGAAGIPCFVLEDGTVTLSPEDVGLHSLSFPAGGACSLDGSGC